MHKQGIHTLLIGTSKTKNNKEYFCEGKNVKRFWGTLGEVNRSFDNGSEKLQPQTGKLLEHGVMFKDIASGVNEDTKDKKIKVQQIQEGFNELESLISQNSSIKNIAFIGKKAVQLFFYRYMNQIVIEEPLKSTLTLDDVFDYGKTNWTVKFNSKNINCYILTNTSRQWDKEKWEDFWKEIF